MASKPEKGIQTITLFAREIITLMRKSLYFLFKKIIEEKNTFQHLICPRPSLCGLKWLTFAQITFFLRLMMIYRFMCDI